jgi:hypothetical protein
LNPKKNIDFLVMKAWYALLNGVISKPVYMIDAPADEEGDYVLLRIESTTDSTNNARHVSNPVLITEVVTRHKTMIDASVAPGIDNEIAQALFPTVGKNALPVQDGIQITDVRRVNATYINEDDGVNRYHRLVTRNVHRVAQLDLTT